MFCTLFLSWNESVVIVTSLVFVTHSDVGIMCNSSKQVAASSGSLHQRSAPLCFYRRPLLLYALLELGHTNLNGSPDFFFLCEVL